MERDKMIDNLRGMAMLAMIVIHAISYFFNDKLSFLIWDYSQWAVPVFFFCSFYLFFKSSKKINFFQYLKKRFLKLFVPYYVFLGFFYILLYFFEKKSFFDLNYLKANIFLYDGLDFNWLVLIFTYLTLLMPLILFFKKNKFLYYGYFLLSLFSSIYLIFVKTNYRLTMWLPWSVLIYFTIYFIEQEKNKKKLFLISFISLLIFLVTRMIEIKIGHNLSQYANKYPPTLYHLSYGIFSIIIIFLLSKKNIFNFLNFDKLLNFLSINSYSLFFIHILVMYYLNWINLKTSNWFTFFLLIFIVSSIIQLSLNHLSKYYSLGRISK
jgi:peptidoglycan/LPS O-acetylase OafA/YrhL